MRLSRALCAIGLVRLMAVACAAGLCAISPVLLVQNDCPDGFPDSVLACAAAYAP